MFNCSNNVCIIFFLFWGVLRQKQEVVNSFTQILEVQNTFFPSVESRNNTKRLVNILTACIQLLNKMNIVNSEKKNVFTVYISVND
jgi:hypothetical protein